MIDSATESDTSPPCETLHHALPLMNISIVTRSVWGNAGNRGKRLRKSLDAVRWQVDKRVFRRPRVIRLVNGVQFTAHPHCVVSSALTYADWPEYWELMFVRKHLRVSDLVIDLGANVGHVSLLLADIVPPRNIYAFEPTPITFARLKANWELNGWPTSGLIQAAVGERKGTIYVPDLSEPATTNSVSDTRTPGTVEVELVRLDDFVDQWTDQKVGFLKIDVEGYEPSVFAGATRLLTESRPRLLMFECLTPAIDSRITSLLSNAGYVTFELDDQGRPIRGRTGRQNVFASPADIACDLVNS